MFRNNLFIKICLSFWLTTFFMIGGVVMVDWLTGSGPFHSPRFPPPGPHLAVHGQALAWIYEHEGLSALRGFADRLHEVAGVRARFLDEKGADLIGESGASGAGGALLVPEAGGPGRLPPGGEQGGG